MRTLERGYMISVKDEILEEPRYTIMRIAIHLYKEQGIKAIRKFYELASKGYCHLATPTWFHAGTRFPQQKSCFLSTIYDTTKDVSRCLHCHVYGTIGPEDEQEDK